MPNPSSIFPRAAPRAAAALCALGAASLVTADALAFCRGVTALAPPGYDPQTQGCFGSQSGTAVLELYWKNLCVGYSLERGASKQVTLAQATQIAKQAFGSWSQVTCSGGGAPSIKAADNGPVDCSAVGYNSNQPNQHVIVFRDDGWPYDDTANTLGLTTIRYDVTDGEIYDADMEINSTDFTLSVGEPPPTGSYDLLSVITHEAGHFLGLAHSTDGAAVMFAHYNPGSTSLAPDDIQGICSVYPANGTRTTSAGVIQGDPCDPTPRHGFSTQCGSPDGGGLAAPADSGANAGDDGGGGTRADTGSGCSTAARSRPAGRLDVAFLGLAGVGLLARRFRRRAGWMRGALLAAGVSLAATATSTVGTREAQASVSIAALFDELVRDASAAAVVTPIEQHALWENQRICTYTRVRVDRLVAGQLPEHVWVRTLGGSVGTIGELVDGEPVLQLNQPSLLFLRPHVDPATRAPLGTFAVAARAQGQFAVVTAGSEPPRVIQANSTSTLVSPLPDRIAQVARLRPGGAAPALARDVLHQRRLEDALREIASAWPLLHPR